MTPTQRRLARHALGLPNRTMCSYRNRYSVNGRSHSNQRSDWVDMRYKGYAELFDVSATMNHYRLTRTGAQLALDPGERLDEEDFGNE
jgi:hypothetical protein